MSLYISEKVGNEIVLKKCAPTVLLYRGFWVVNVNAFAGTIVSCGTDVRYIGSNEKTSYRFTDSGTYTFVATRGGETITKTVVLDDKDPDNMYIVNLGMYIGLQRIEYIESTGIQYIDTGIIQSEYRQNLIMEMDVQFTELPNSSWTRPKSYVGGCDENGNYFLPFCLRDSNKFSSNVGLGGTDIDPMDGDLNRHKVVVNTVNGTLKIDNQTFNYSSNVANIEKSIYLFIENGSDLSSIGKIRLYSCTFKDGNGNVIKDFVPVLDNTLHGCMYDKVSEDIYYNAGTGEFITGPSTAYDELVYIETDPLHEKQWIDSEYIPNYKSAIEYNVQLLEVPNGRYVFGNYDTDSQYYMYTNNGTSKWEFGWSSAYTTSSNNRDTNFHSFYLYTDNGMSFMKCDDNIVASASTVSQTETHTLPLLSGRNNGTSTEVGITLQQKFFGCKIWDDGTLVRDMIPVKRKNGDVCIYDKVNEEFYYNKGTGHFIAGPVKSYTELSYLESSGTQYIDLGFAPTLNTEVDIVAQYLSINNSEYDTIIGHSGSSNTNRFYPLSSIRGNNVLRSSWGSEQNYTFPFDTNIHEIKYNTTNTHKIIRDGVEIVTLPTGSYTPNGRSLYLFICNTQNEPINPAWPATARVYECQIYDNGTLVRDLVPAKRSDNVLGMLDKVNDKFYINRGTGSFIAGPSLDYTELQWIQSNGTQYINTEIQRLLTNDYKIESGITYSDISTRQLNGVGGYTYFGVVNGYYQVSRQGTDHQNLPAISDNMTTFEIDFDCPNNKMRYSINDGTETEENVSYINNPENGEFYLFALGTGGGYPSSQKLHYFKLYKNNVLVRDFIPVKTDTDEVCLFDKVTHRYFHNIGTGNFIAGPEK